MEWVLLSTMYELPSLENVSKVVVDESVINHQTEPYLIYTNTPVVGGIRGVDRALNRQRRAGLPARFRFREPVYRGSQAEAKRPARPWRA